MVTSRREEYAEATRRALLDAARDAFVSRGFADSSLDGIAATARVTKGALYHHFPSKQELFQAVFEELEEEMVAVVTQAAAKKKEPWAQMTAGMAAYFDLCRDRTFRRIIVEEGPTALGWELWRRLEEGYTLGLIQASLRALMAAGDLRRQPVDMLARLLFAILTEAGVAVATAADPTAARRQAQAIVGQLLSGLRVGGAG